MKSTELMIGDWVGRVFDDKRIDYRQVDWIRTGEIGMRYQKVWAIGCIEPIPLTPEILEKNGFKKIDFSHYQINDRTLVLDADGKWDGEVSWHWVVTQMSTNSKGQNVVLDYYVATLNYAHQLQHALRLCGLNELADNFKVYEK